MLSKINYIVFVGTMILLQGKSDGSEWSYGDGPNGPNHWPEISSICAGMSQSPINIKSKDVKPKSLGPICFTNYGGLLGMKLKNNGHGAEVDITSDKAYIEGSGLADNKYELAQFHFHWGSSSKRGSEHTLNNKVYPAELHLVHFNTKYPDVSQAAVMAPNGLAVLGVFIEVGKKDNPAFANIISGLANVTYPGSTQDIDSVPLESLLPSDTSLFYRYQGSLTTPGCYESVQWTVFRKPVRISKAQLEQFRTLMSSEGDILVDNFRPTQELNNREVYFNKGKSSKRRHG